MLRKVALAPLGPCSALKETPVVLEAIEHRHSSVCPGPLLRSYGESDTTPDAFLLDDLVQGRGATNTIMLRFLKKKDGLLPTAALAQLRNSQQLWDKRIQEAGQLLWALYTWQGLPPNVRVTWSQPAARALLINQHTDKLQDKRP